jgi:mono/diheme cytochrome c family protein
MLARSISALSLALALPACATAVVRPDAADAHWAAEKWPGTTVEDLARGREVFVGRCAGCHTLPRPDVKTTDEWAGVVAEMAPGARLSSEDRDLVLRYLSAASARLRRAGVGEGGASKRATPPRETGS